MMKQESKDDILIIVPCYNEEKRLKMDVFLKFSRSYRFLFVNDGSTDNTSELIKPHLGDRIMLYEMPQNSGKAEAVRHGFLHILEEDFVHEPKWIGYWDADLSTPLEEIEKFLHFKDNFAPNCVAILGSRVKRLGSTIQRSVKRHFLGRLFTTVVDNLFHIGCYDSQCGAKLFKKEIVKDFCAQPFISKWAFDVELILRIKDHELVEYPMSEWRDVAGSKLNVFTVAPQIIIDLYRMRQRYRS